MRETRMLIGFAADIAPTDFKEDILADTNQPDQSVQFFLKLIFASEEAAYYQFDLFPDLSARFVLGSARKRSGAIQFIRIALDRPESLQSFIEICRANPHLVRIEESTEDEFESAPSNAI
ncbi:MAG TPA: hypothetical protein VIT91_02060 [Chthoniobacterales bacterium]